MSELDYKYIASLVIRAQNDDSNAFAELYAITYNKIYNYACHYLRDTYLAQDAVQEIYINALKKINKINDPSLFVAWLNQIAFHVCYDMSKPDKNTDEFIEPEILEFVEADFNTSNPEVQYVRKKTHSLLRASIDELPFSEKQVIILRFYRNMKIEDIASAMSVSRSSIKRYLAQAQEHLKEALHLM